MRPHGKKQLIHQSNLSTPSPSPPTLYNTISTLTTNLFPSPHLKYSLKSQKPSAKPPCTPTLTKIPTQAAQSNCSDTFHYTISTTNNSHNTISTLTTNLFPSPHLQHSKK